MSKTMNVVTQLQLAGPRSTGWFGRVQVRPSAVGALLMICGFLAVASLTLGLAPVEGSLSELLRELPWFALGPPAPEAVASGWARGAPEWWSWCLSLPVLN
jgi:hypothetical protein